MYEKDFPRVLNQKIDYFFIYGSCELSLFLRLEQLKKKFSCEQKLFLSQSDYSLNTAYDFLSQNSIFSNSKLLIIESTKALSSKDLKALISLCDDEKKLIFCLRNIKAQADIEKVFNGYFLRVFDKKNTNERMNILNDFCAFYNIKASYEALLFLERNYEFDIFKAGCELLKYKNLSLNINDLKEQVSEDDFINFDDFFFAFIFNDEVNNLIYSIVNSEDSIALLNKLYSQFLRLFSIIAYVKENANIDFKVCLGYTPPIDVCKKLEQAARIIDYKTKDILLLLQECELDLKRYSSDYSQQKMISQLIKLHFLIKN